MEKEEFCYEEAFLLVSFVLMEVVIQCFAKNEMNNPIRKCVEWLKGIEKVRKETVMRNHLTLSRIEGIQQQTVMQQPHAYSK